MKKIYILTATNACEGDVYKVTAHNTLADARAEMKRQYDEEVAIYKENQEGDEPDASLYEDEAYLVYGYEPNDMYVWLIHEVALPE